ncbi:hypothetical protein LTR94_032807, partial [Friedmanniomyces endolithicus]
AEARRHQLPADRHGCRGCRDAADPPDQRAVAVLRDVLHQREGAQGQSGRARGAGLGNRHPPVAARAQLAVGWQRFGEPDERGQERAGDREEISRRGWRGADRRCRPAHPHHQARDGPARLRADAAACRVGGQGQCRAVGGDQHHEERRRAHHAGP